MPKVPKRGDEHSPSKTSSADEPEILEPEVIPPHEAEGPKEILTATEAAMIHSHSNAPAPVDEPSLSAAVVDTSRGIDAQSLLSQAIQAGVGPEIMDRLVAMRQEVSRERAEAAFNRDLSLFQAECPPIPKSKRGAKADYAPLEGIIAVARPFLQKYGFSWTFKVDHQKEDDKILVTCEARHREGHMEPTHSWPIEVERIISGEGKEAMSKVHRDASAVSYGKRYTFVNAFGLQPGQEDDDAAKAGKEPESLSTQILENLSRRIGQAKTQEELNAIGAEVGRKRKYMEEAHLDGLREIYNAKAEEIAHAAGS